MSRRLFYTDHYTLPLPEGHRFPISKYKLLREMLERDSLFEFVPAPLAKPEVIALVHDAAYVEQFVQGELSAQAMRRIGFPWSPELVKRTLGSVGGTLSAGMDALSSGFGGTLAGGTHHAFRSEGSGYCVFNDIAIAILYLRSKGLAQRAAVIDLDVHQGDGTAQIFQNDALVLTISVHSRANFPFRKQVSKIDIELEDATHDDEYLNVVDGLLPRVADFKPEILFYQSGVDGLATDSLGRLALTHAGLKERDRRVCTFARSFGVPLVITLGGGYSLPIEHTVTAHANTFRTAADVFVV
ncbi:histone deacetylase superfamily [Candidatus Koribacter versatilis Ellin345]|uniref:Histone deacetylase superfamily n=1 Tax=Koribacter versatilis (strain Ellin345) TaxID=204669 RepID=Q1IMW0_KORVE|nr:histone deacetylase [Candidatus Koribacter versatilis]ABF41790.1 histone deacetylase superfamily [Candidatus Koribacter versatilis Ellin345]